MLLCNRIVLVLEQRLKIVEDNSERNADCIKTLDVTVQQNRLDIDREIQRERKKIDNQPTDWPVLYSQSAINVSPKRKRYNVIAATGSGLQPSAPEHKARHRFADMIEQHGDNTPESSADTDISDVRPHQSALEDAVDSSETQRGVDDEGFKLQPHQKRKLLRAQRDKNTITGKRQNSLIKSGRKYADIFVYNVHNDTEENVIKTFITDEQVPVSSIHRMSRDESATQSFKLTINFDDLSKVMVDTFWPDGIRCRRFWNRQKDNKGS